MPEEYISRAEALKAANEWVSEACMAPVMRVSRLLDKLQKVPAADVAPVVHGKWLLDRWPSWPHRECSRCKVMFPRTTEVADRYWQYCPNCGARMDGAAE